MPYDPKAITTDDRTWSYKAMWAGLPISLLLLCGTFIPGAEQLRIIAGGFASGQLIGMLWVGRQDEFAQKELAFASNWGLAFLGFTLILTIVPSLREQNFEAHQVIAIFSVIFNAGVYWRRIADGALSSANS